MLIEIHQPFKAFRLDEEGDPVGGLVEMPPGKYRPLGGFTDDEEYGGVSVWLEPEGKTVTYEARGIVFRS
jgi:hypothetical protein